MSLNIHKRESNPDTVLTQLELVPGVMFRVFACACLHALLCPILEIFAIPFSNRKPIIYVITMKTKGAGHEMRVLRLQAHTHTTV